MTPDDTTPDPVRPGETDDAPAADAPAADASGDDATARADVPGDDAAAADVGAAGTTADEASTDDASGADAVADDASAGAAAPGGVDPADVEVLGEDEQPASGPPKTAVVLSSIALVVVVVGLVFAFLNSRTPPAYTFDGEAVSRAEAAERIDGLEPGLGEVILNPEEATPEELAQARQQLNFEIVYEMLQKAADERDIEITEEQIRDSVREFLAPEAGEEDLFAAAAEATGATEERIRRETEANLIYEALVESADLPEATDTEIQEAYDSGQFPDLSSPGLNIIQSQSEEEIQEAHERLESGEDFAAVASSIDPTYSGPQRGFDPQFLPEGMQEAVGALEPGGYTEPINLEEAGAEGFAILQVVPAPELDEVSSTIVEALQGQAQNEFLSNLISETEEASEITVDPVFGEWVNGQGIVAPDAAPLGPPAGAPAGGEDAPTDQ